MSLTRRSFIKKSSYSAAAVTILGTGSGFGNHVESYNTLHRWETRNLTIDVTTTVVVVTAAAIPAPIDYEELFVNGYLANKSNIFIKNNSELFEWGSSIFEVGDFEVVGVQEIVPNPVPLNQGGVVVENLPGGGVKYTMVSNVIYVVTLSNKPEQLGNVF